MAAGAARLHAAARPLLLRCWGARSRDARLRDCLVTYLHIQARLPGRWVGVLGVCPTTRACAIAGRLCAHSVVFQGFKAFVPQPKTLCPQTLNIQTRPRGRLVGLWGFCAARAAHAAVARACVAAWSPACTLLTHVKDFLR